MGELVMVKVCPISLVLLLDADIVLVPRLYKLLQARSIEVSVERSNTEIESRRVYELTTNFTHDTKFRS